jgi:tetratricopeptide (TPR) repeat protein
VDAAYLKIPEAARKEFEKASRLLKDKRAEESVEYFEKALRIHFDFPAAHMLLGTAYMDLQRWAEAQTELEKSIAQDPNQSATHLALGSCLAAQGKFSEAEKPLLRGLDLNETAAEGYLELGRVYWALGRWTAAESYARKALVLRPTLALAHVLMGNALLRRRDANGALAAFREYLRLDPKGPFAANTREVVSRLEAQIGQPKS